MPAQSKYPNELRERVVKIVSEVWERDGKGHGETARVARQLGINPEVLRMDLGGRRKLMTASGRAPQLKISSG